MRTKKSIRKLPTVGIAWYTEQNWVRVRATARDPDRFESTFDEWIKMAERALVDFRKAGINAIKVMVDADDFALWCAKHTKENDATARPEFVSAQVRREHETND